MGDIGENLHRPECVLCSANGRIYASNWRGGVTVIEPDGHQWELIAKQPAFDVRPNGIALMPDGSFLLAQLGDEIGGVWRLPDTGALTPFVVEVDGTPLPPTNFAHLDSAGRVWITVSTRQAPRSKGYSRDVADGFIVLVDQTGTRVVADDLGFANECLVHPDEKHLFVNETFSRRLSRFDIVDGGRLTNKQTVCEFGDGVFPDGMAFDAEGGIWIVSIVSNRVLRLSPDGNLDVVIDDSDPDHLAWVEQAYQGDGMDRPHLDQIESRRLRSISSLAFGGADMKTGYLGCLLGDTIASFTTGVPGHPPPHWNFTGPARPRSH